VGLLAACPQLYSDEFYISVRRTDGSDAGGSHRDGGTEDAGGAGGSAGAVPPPDAGGSNDGTDSGPLPADPLVSALAGALAHRYGFAGTGSAVVDSVGSAHGSAVNAQLDGQGRVSLSAANQHVNLPNGLLSYSNDKTLEVWVTWHGGNEWQRLFDFGSSDESEGGRGIGITYLYLVPKGDGHMIAAYTHGGYDGETRLHGTLALPVDRVAHVALVIDSQSNRLSLYLDGRLNAFTPLSERLASIEDENMWLGMSQYSGDPPLLADLTEFRIYDRALGADELALSYRLGADATLAP
jgi:hypothetical protein